MDRRSFFKRSALALLLGLLPKRAKARSGTKCVGKVPVSHWTITTTTSSMADIGDKTYYFDGEDLVELDMKNRVFKTFGSS